MPRITVGTENGHDVEVHYDDVGTGSPVVLIHGWPLSSRSWEKQVPALVQAGHRVVTYDRRGFGQSSQPGTGYDYDTLADDLDVLLSALDLTGVALVGFSMGGGEVVRYLAKHGSARVAKAVLASAVPPFLKITDDNPDGGLDDATADSFVTGLTQDRVGFLDQFSKDFFSPGKNLLGQKELVSEAARTYHRDIAAWASPQGTLGCVTAFGTTDFRPDMAAVAVPTLVIHGDSDQVVPFEASGKRSHEMLASSELVLIQGGPHGVNATHPEEFNAALVEFLAR